MTRCYFDKIVYLVLGVVCSLYAGSAYAQQQAESVRLKPPFPQDMVFGIADTKYNDQQDTPVKILEFGDGSHSKYAGHDRLCGVASIWNSLWDRYASYGVPLWCVRLPAKRELLEAMGIERFFEVGGKVVDNLTDLKANIITDIISTNGYITKELCQAYQAIVLIKTGRPYQAIRQFHESFPAVVFVGEKTTRFMSNKYETNALFSTPELQAYRPRCKPCAKRYTSTLAQEIIDELGGEVFVLKPVNACRGRGIIFVTRDMLDTTLELILARTDQLASYGVDDSYTYWAEDRNEVFLVEQYVPSKTIVVQGKSYDATLRMVFTIDSCSPEQEPAIDLLGCYWKLPAKDLDQKGTWTEKHKSDMGGNIICSARVVPDDRQCAWASLKHALGLVYTQMTQQRDVPCMYQWSVIDDDSV